MSLSSTIFKISMQLKALPWELLGSWQCMYIAGDLHPNKERYDFSNHNLGDDLNIPLVDSTFFVFKPFKSISFNFVQDLNIFFIVFTFSDFN